LAILENLFSPDFRAIAARVVVVEGAITAAIAIA